MKILQVNRLCWIKHVEFSPGVLFVGVAACTAICIRNWICFFLWKDGHTKLCDHYRKEVDVHMFRKWTDMSRTSMQSLPNVHWLQMGAWHSCCQAHNSAAGGLTEWRAIGMSHYAIRQQHMSEPYAFDSLQSCLLLSWVTWSKTVNDLLNILNTIIQKVE